MSALQVATLLPHLDKLTSSAGERWVSAALAQADALREHEAMLFPRNACDRDASDRLRDAWRVWLTDANALLRRLEELSMPMPTGVAALRQAAGRAAVILQQDPGMIQARQAQADRGEVLSIEEVRRELRTGVRG